MSPARLASLLVAALVTVPMIAGLTGCSFAGRTCHGTEGRLKQLAAQPILGSHPAGASAPANYPDAATTGCDDDSSGPAWLHADRVYAFPGTPTEVIDHYLKAAPAAGWRREENTDSLGAPSSVEDLCFTKGAKGHAMLLTVDFRVEAYWPAPVLGRGLGYEVSVGSEAGGGAAGDDC